MLLHALFYRRPLVIHTITYRYSYSSKILNTYMGENEAYNTMHSNVLLFYTPLTPVGGQNVKAFYLWPFGLGKKTLKLCR